jgi:hypothetical protein
MKCSAGPNDYHLLARQKLVLTLRDCQQKITNTITASINWDLYDDLIPHQGELASKDAWWEVYLWMKEQERLQDEI